MDEDLSICNERCRPYSTHRRQRSYHWLYCVCAPLTLRNDPDVSVTSTQGRCFRALLERAQRQFTMPQKSNCLHNYFDVIINTPI